MWFSYLVTVYCTKWLFSGVSALNSGNFMGCHVISFLKFDFVLSKVVKGSFPGIKRPGRGADHPPPSSAEVKKE
jgi:hypothetical protein